MLHWGVVNLTIGRGLSISWDSLSITSLRIRTRFESFQQLDCVTCFDAQKHFWGCCLLCSIIDSYSPCDFPWGNLSGTLFSEMLSHKVYLFHRVIYHNSHCQRFWEPGVNSVSFSAFSYWYFAKEASQVSHPVFELIAKRRANDRMDRQTLVWFPFILVLY